MGPATEKHQTPTHRLKLYVGAVIESEDTKEKADICNRQFQSAFTREANSDPPSKGDSSFSSIVEITVDLKGVAKLLDRLNEHTAPCPDGLNGRVLKDCSTQISPIKH